MEHDEELLSKVAGIIADETFIDWADVDGGGRHHFVENPLEVAQIVLDAIAVHASEPKYEAWVGMPHRRSSVYHLSLQGQYYALCGVFPYSKIPNAQLANLRLCGSCKRIRATKGSPA